MIFLLTSQGVSLTEVQEGLNHLSTGMYLHLAEVKVGKSGSFSLSDLEGITSLCPTMTYVLALSRMFILLKLKRWFGGVCTLPHSPLCCLNCNLTDSTV